MPIDVNYTSPDQLSDQLLTLSLLPEYRWKNLARQDLIRERNKPKEALRLPEKAPFFLPTIPGLEPVFDVSARDLTEGASTKTKSVLLFIGKQSAFFESLEGAKTSEEECRKPFNLLAELSPALIEAEIRLLSPDAGGSIEVLKNFLRCAAAAIKDGKNQELVQSYLELFLKLHISTLEGERVDREFLQLLRALREHVALSAKRLEDLLDQSLNVVLFLKHVAL
jgi:U3 small nucleolar RNA-associated protein 21